MTSRKSDLTCTADRVFRNAKVYSVSLDDTVTRAEAVAVKDGKIVYVGTNDGVQAYVGDTTEITECQGNTLLPGFGDGHMHLGVSSKRYAGVIFIDLREIDPQEGEYYAKEMQKRLRSYADAHPDAKAILGFGWDRGWFDGSQGFPVRPITREDLDAAVPDKPVILDSFCGHVCLFNSKALEEAGLLHTGVEQIDGGIIRIGKDGVPDGYVAEMAAIYAVKALTPSSAETKEGLHAGLSAALADFARQGLTLASDYLHVQSSYETIAQMARDGELTLRMSGSFTIYDNTADEDLAYAVEHMHTYDVDDLVKADAAKFFVDGNPATFTPYTEQSIRNNGYPEGFCGELLWDEEHLNTAAAAAQKAGFNLHAHAMGDRGVAVAAAAFSAARSREDPEKKARNVIIHITLATDESKRIMAESGMIANLQPLWAAATENNSVGEYENFGKAREKEFYPFQSIIDTGVTVAFGSDFPVEPCDIFGGIQSAITRLPAPTNVQYKVSKNDPLVNPAERISFQNAIKGYTINTAYELGLETVTGSIEVGKSAELVLIDRDLEATPVDQIYSTKVLETVFKGKTVYKA